MAAKPKADAARMAREIDQDLKTIRQILRRPVEAEFARGNLTAPQQAVMHALVHSNGLSLKELSTQMGLAHSTVSGIVDRLEKQTLVERRADSTDARITRITASQHVHEFVKNQIPALTIHPLSEALASCTDAQRRRILDGVRTLRRVLEKNGKE